MPKSCFAVLMATTLVVGCGGSEPTPDDVTSVSIISGNGQEGTVRQPLPVPLTVAVTTSGAPNSGVSVTWSTSAAGGSLTPASVITGADGRASVNWMLGTTSGAQTATASISGPSASAAFSATALAAAAAGLEDASGNGQTGEINTALAQPVVAIATDEFGNAVAGVGVNWAATGATLSASTDVTDASGVSDVTVTLGGTAGPITITAASEGLDGSPVTFTATATEAVPIPTTASVTVRNNNFFSVRNATSSPAVDTVAVGGTVTWTWAETATNPHNVTSTGTPGFPGRETAVQPPPYSHTFTSAGTYNYLCTVHGTVMNGRVVVR